MSLSSINVGVIVYQRKESQNRFVITEIDNGNFKCKHIKSEFECTGVVRHGIILITNNKTTTEYKKENKDDDINTIL